MDGQFNRFTKWVLKVVCEVTKHGKPCTSPAWCLYRKRVYVDGQFVYRHMYVCEAHAKNRDRTNDTYANTLLDVDGNLKSYSGETSPYWEHFDKQFDRREEMRANPDSVGDNVPCPWKPEKMCDENEELVRRVKDNLRSLSFREGQILNLMCYKNMSQAEIARFLNIKKQVVNKCLKTLKNKMKSMGD